MNSAVIIRISPCFMHPPLYLTLFLLVRYVIRDWASRSLLPPLCVCLSAALHRVLICRSAGAAFYCIIYPLDCWQFPESPREVDDSVSRIYI